MKYKKIALLVAGPMIFYGSSVLSNDRTDLTAGSATKNFIATINELTFINFDDNGMAHTVVPRQAYTTVSSGAYYVKGCWATNDSSVSLQVSSQGLEGKTPIPELVVSLYNEGGETTPVGADHCKKLSPIYLAKPLISYSHALDIYDPQGTYQSRLIVSVAGN